MKNPMINSIEKHLKTRGFLKNLHKVEKNGTKQDFFKCLEFNFSVSVEFSPNPSLKMSPESLYLQNVVALSQ